MLAAIALAILAPPNAELGIILDKEVYAPGESIQVSAVVRNKGKVPFAVATTTWDGRLSANLSYELWCGERQYWPKFGENSMPQFSQVVFGREVTSDRFDMAYPGRGANVGFFNFSKAAHTGHTRLKADPMPDVFDLPPGVYELRLGYRFTGPFDMYEFTPSARKLFDMAFKGELKATKRFTVRR